MSDSTESEGMSLVESGIMTGRSNRLRSGAYIFRIIFVAFAACLCSRADAQFYAPETRFHDIAQRHYVVELARVLAWRENQQQPKIAEIAYTLASGTDGSTNWDVRCLDAQGSPVHEFNVSYPAGLLLDGPGFYRDIFKQMTAGMKPETSLTSQQLIDGYWKGADGAGYSRIAGLRAAFDIVNSGSAGGEMEPQLAGLLAHSALSSLSDSVSLDPVLLARSAAWLAISESMVKKSTGSSLDALWCPLLFLAGRENAAGDIWKKAGPAKPNAMAACWDYLLAQPKLEDVCVFVAKPENRRFMLPFMNYYCRREESTCDFEKLLPRLFGDQQTLALLYDHLPCIVRHGSVSTGHPLSNSAPFARRDWIDCLRKFKPGQFDFTGYKSQLDAQPPFLPLDSAGIASDEQEFTLLGFDQAAPLIELGNTEGLGKLIPVPVVTARDLLNYGWEMTGLEMGARYDFVANNWGVPDLAKSISDEVRSKVSGLDAFMTVVTQASRAALANSERLQDVEYLIPHLTDNAQFWKQTWPNYDEFTSRYWLRGPDVRIGCCALYYAHKRNLIIPYIERVRSEGGPLCDGYIRQWFADDLRDDGLLQVPGAADYKEKMAVAQKQKEIDQLTVFMLYHDYERMPAMARAQEFERNYWQAGCEGIYPDIFDSYIEAHAYDAAKRFYLEAEPRIEPVGFSDSMGPRRFVLGWLEGDQAAMDESVRASDTGSYADFELLILAAAARDDFKAMENQIDQCIDRYGKDPEMSLLESFVPLIPALRDPANPDHDKALDYFAQEKHSRWITLQWILSDRAKLTTEERIRFFGGPKGQWARQFVVLALQNDKAGFSRKLDQHERTWRQTHQVWDWEDTVLIHYLRNQLLEIPVPPQQPDLKPADAMTLSERVISSLGAK